MVSSVRASIGASVLVGLTLSALLMLMATVPAQAQTLEDCQAKIAELRDATVAAQTFTNDNDQAGLIGKLDSASTKLSQGKTQDALAILTSVRDKVSTLVAQGKLDQADADVLLPEINEAIGCVEVLQAQAPTAA